MGRSELGPALMGRSVGFTRTQIRKLSGRWTQRTVNLRKRSQEFIHKGMMCWTRGCWNGINATYRWLGNSLKTQCLVRSEHVWGQNTCGPGCCSYLEHISSTDCAFSCTFDFRPVFCLVFRHRISFQPL